MTLNSIVVKYGGRKVEHKEREEARDQHRDSLGQPGKRRSVTTL